MMDDALRQAVRAAVRGEVRDDEPMRAHTSWRVGGPADLWIAPKDLSDLQSALATLGALSVPWVVIGKGSNVLVSDKGIRGAVVNLEAGFADIRHTIDAIEPGVHRLCVGAGASISAVLHYVIRFQLAGVELWTGIPGTVGGAVRMNAGTHLGETKDVFIDAQVLRPDGVVELRDRDALGFSYRHSALEEGAVVLEAAFRVETARDASSAQIMQDTKARRRATQPVTLPTGGSTFANPPGKKAWELIDQVGLRGRRVGDAEISALHPNFIVNLGSATAEDVDTLIRLAADEVERRFKIRLRPEVVRVGEWEEMG